MRFSFRFPCLRPAALAAFSLLLSLPVQAQNPNYTFTLIAESSTTLGGFGNVALNNAGAVAFGAGRTAGSGPFTSLHTGSGGALTTVADTSGAFRSFNYDSPAFNDQGTVAFIARLQAGGSGVFTSSNGIINALYDSTSGAFQNYSFGSVDLNDADQVAFTASRSTTGTMAGINGVFSGNGGPAATIVSNTINPMSGGGYSDVALNNTGAFAFKSLGRLSQSLQLRGSDGVFTTVASVNSLINDFGALALNDTGVVAFTQYRAVGQGIGTAIYTK